MGPGKPITGKFFTRKEFFPEIYLLSDIVDKVLMCKTRNKDKFIEDQLKITAAIYLGLDINWAGLLLHQLKTSVLKVAQGGTPKRKFMHIINYLLRAIYPDMHITSGECTTHTALKKINLTTLKSLEKVMHLVDTPPLAPSAASKPAAAHAISQQTRPKTKRPASTTPPSKPSKKQKKHVYDLTDEDLTAKAAQ